MMSKIYTVEEIKILLKTLNLSHEKLSEMCNCTRASITQILNKLYTKRVTPKLQLVTYVLRDYMSNDLGYDMDKIETIEATAEITSHLEQLT